MKIISRKKIDRVHIIAKQSDKNLITYLNKRGYIAAQCKTILTKLELFKYGFNKRKPSKNHSFDVVSGYVEVFAERPLKRKLKEI